MMAPVDKTDSFGDNEAEDCNALHGIRVTENVTDKVLEDVLCTGFERDEQPLTEITCTLANSGKFADWTPKETTGTETVPELSIRSSIDSSR